MDNIQTLITENLHIWSSAIDEKKSGRGRGGANKDKIYGIKKLRELILDLAVRGKLVPQDPNDEPASNLLKRIEADYQKKVKSGIVRKRRTPKTYEQNNQTIDLPRNWISLKLGDIGDWGAGATPPRGHSEYYGGDIPWFKSGELVDDYIYETEEKVTELALKKCSLRENKIGDVLIAMYGATIGKASILKVEGTTNQAVCACTVYDGVFNAFLLYYLKASRPRFISQGAGGAQPNISREKIIATDFQLPPLAEQHRIVVKVDELMKLCDDLEAGIVKSYDVHAQLVETLLDNLCSSKNPDNFNSKWQIIHNNFETLFTTEESIEKLKQSILQLAIMGKLVPQDPNDEPASELLKRIQSEKQKLIAEGKLKKEKPLPPITEEEKPFELPLGWEWVRLGNITDLITSGSRDWAKFFVRDGAVFLTMGNLSRGNYKLRLDTLRYVKPPINQEGTRTKVRSGDILLSITGEVGNLALIPNDFPESYINQHTCIIRPSKILNSRYLPEALLSNHLKKQYDGPQRGVKNSFRLSDVSQLSFPLPPISEQLRIVERIDCLMEICDSLISKVSNTNDLKRNLADSVSEQLFRVD